MSMWIIFLATVGVSFLAAARVKSVYRRYSQGVVRSGVTGAEAAALILQRAGIRDVKVEAHDQMLGDHYDPLRKRLVLSTENFFGSSPAALGVAAHECGHAIQHQRAYRPLQWRMAAVGITTYANQVVLILPLLFLFTGLIEPMVAATLLLASWGVIMLFNLVTLPVEFDASRRARQVLLDMDLIAPGPEAAAVSKVLNAAAWTYVAAFLTSLVYFVWHLMPLLTGRQRD